MSTVYTDEVNARVELFLETWTQCPEHIKNWLRRKENESPYVRPEDKIKYMDSVGFTASLYNHMKHAKITKVSSIEEAKEIMLKDMEKKS